MREVKFRAWDKEKKIWISNGEIEFSISEGSMTVCPNTVEHVGDSVHDMYVSERFSVQQYTGLKDKNGVEIYEGDVIKWHYFSEGVDVVEYSNTNAAFAPFYRLRLDRVGETFEVIGNIYENPELLTQAS